MSNRMIIALLVLAGVHNVRAETDPHMAVRYMHCSASMDAVSNSQAEGAGGLPRIFGLQLIGLKVSNLPDQFGNYRERYRVEIDRPIYRVPSTFEMVANMDRIERLYNGNQYLYSYHFVGGIVGYMLNPSFVIELSYDQMSDNRFGRIRLENGAGLLAYYSVTCGKVEFSRP